MRILCDTNVLISAIVATGVCDELLEYCNERHQLVCSSWLYSELRNKLKIKFKLSNDDLRLVLELVEWRMHFVEPATPLPKLCRDPTDDHVLAAALGGTCDCIITGDKDLLSLRVYEGISIIAPGQFWKFEADFLSSRGGE